MIETAVIDTPTVAETVCDDLCCGCGFCAAVCPRRCIQMSVDERKGVYHPVIDDERCSRCGLCATICPGRDDAWVTASPADWLRNNRHHPRLGYYSRLLLGYSSHPSIRRQASSGGIVTELLIYLHRFGFIDGAVTTVMNPGEPLIAEPVIARTPEEIRGAQQSKYCPVPLGTIVGAVKAQPGRYALVGLPCHINAIRKIKRTDEDLAERLPFLVGLFCSRTPGFHATRYILEKRNIPPGEVKEIAYRSGVGHIGHMEIRTKSERIIRVPHLHFDYWGFMFSKCFIPARCYLCSDKTAETADISLGDNWSSTMRHRDGASTMIIRSASLVPVIEKMIDKHRLVVETVDEDRVVESQDLIAKQNLGPRRFWWRFFGGKPPGHDKTDRNDTNIFRALLSLPGYICFAVSRVRRPPGLLTAMGRVFWALDAVAKYSATSLRLAKKGLTELTGIVLALMPATPVVVKKEAPRKIVIIGGYGSRDMGDEAMPHCDIIHFRQHFGDSLEIVMLSENPEFTRAFHRERAIQDIEYLGFSARRGIWGGLFNILIVMRMAVFLMGSHLLKRGIHVRLWPSAHRGLREIASCDLVFNVGGGNLNSIIPNEFFKKGMIYTAAEILGKPVVVSGQTIGPFTGTRDRLFARFTLNTPRMITFRDKEISHARCREAGITEPVLTDAADDAMTLPMIGEHQARAFLASDPGVSDDWLNLHGGLTVCMNLKGSLRLFNNTRGEVDLFEITRRFALLTDWIIKTFGARVLFVPTDFCPEVDDREQHRLLVSLIEQKHRTAQLENEYDDVSLKGIISLGDAAIGARYHFCVFAASLHLPFLGVASGVYQMTKLKGLALLNDLPECFYENDMETADAADLFSRVTWLLSNRESISNRLKVSVPVLKKRSRTAVAYAIDLMERG